VNEAEQPAAKAKSAPIVVALAALALVVVLVVGRATNGGSETTTQRADRIASEIRCPTCQGQSVRDSKAASARAIYSEVVRQVGAGETDADIRGFLVSRFGTSELLRPNATGIASIVWIAPVAFLVGALAFLVRIFLRTRTPSRSATNDDHLLVAQALADPSGVNQ
jgi:cytochrome c-type biogenesis protein CcmH